MQSVLYAPWFMSVWVGLCPSSSQFSLMSFVIRTNGSQTILVTCSIAIKSASANVERNKLAACIEIKHVARRDYCKPSHELYPFVIS